jgi:hypothetical protein
MEQYRHICARALAFTLMLVPQSILTTSSQMTVTGAGEGAFHADAQKTPQLKTRAIVTGAGEGTFDADIDGDGDIDGSYFGVAVHRVDHGRRSSVEGHFVCAMWGKTDVLGLPLMAVEGVVSSATMDLEKPIVTLRGVGTVDLGTGPSGFFTNVPFQVRIREGGPGIGSIKLTVIGTFDGVPGDTEPGNGNYDLPVEKVFSGHIRIE